MEKRKLIFLFILLFPIKLKIVHTHKFFWNFYSVVERGRKKIYDGKMRSIFRNTKSVLIIIISSIYTHNFRVTEIINQNFLCCHVLTSVFFAVYFFFCSSDIYFIKLNLIFVIPKRI